MKHQDDYRVITKDTAGHLSDAVCDAIDHGWQCQGGMSAVCASLSGRITYYQAMVKYSIPS